MISRIIAPSWHEGKGFNFSFASLIEGELIPGVPLTPASRRKKHVVSPVSKYKHPVQSRTSNTSSCQHSQAPAFSFLHIPLLSEGIFFNFPFDFFNDPLVVR